MWIVGALLAFCLLEHAACTLRSTKDLNESELELRLGLGMNSGDRQTVPDDDDEVKILNPGDPQLHRLRNMPKRARTHREYPSHTSNLIGAMQKGNSVFPREIFHQASSSKDQISTTRREWPPISPNSGPSDAERRLQVVGDMSNEPPPVFRPEFYWEENAGILLKSRSYIQTVDALSPGILNLKQTYPDMARLSQNIQSLVNNVMVCFGRHMPQHRWFVGYGDRIFPELVSWQSHGVDTQAILGFHKNLLNKWTWVIDYVRHLERERPHKLILASTPMVVVLDALIRSNWDEGRIHSLLRLSFEFARSQLPDREPAMTLKTLEALRWLVEGILICAADSTSSEMKGMRESRMIQNAFPKLKGSHPNGFWHKPRKPASELQAFLRKTILRNAEQSKVEELEAHFCDLLRHLSNISSSSQIAQHTFMKSIRKQYFDSVAYPESFSAVQSFKPAEENPWHLKEVLAQLPQGPTDKTVSDNDRFEPEALSHPLLPVPRMQVNQANAVLSEHARKFMQSISTNKQDKMTHFSYVKFCVLFELAAGVWQNKAGQDILLHEILPLLVLGNHSKPPAVTDSGTDASFFRQIVHYVYDNTELAMEEASRFKNIQEQLINLKERIASERNAFISFMQIT